MIRFCLEDKTPREEDVYTVDWKPYLGPDDVLVGATPIFEVLDGTVTVDTLSNDIANGLSTFWLRGGALGEVARVLIGIDSAGGKKLDGICTIGVRK